MTPAPFIDQFPECPVKNCLANPGDLSHGYVQVMEREQSFPVGSTTEFNCGMATADIACTGKIGELVNFKTPVSCQVPPFLCRECICCRIKKITAHGCSKGKHGRVAGPEQVDAG